ncbi:MAG: hypothetical protein AVDCRST_MAG17-68, partial [uncultured Solirubrobacterales bacterium]
ARPMPVLAQSRTASGRERRRGEQRLQCGARQLRAADDGATNSTSWAISGSWSEACPASSRSTERRARSLRHSGRAHRPHRV